MRRMAIILHKIPALVLLMVIAIIASIIAAPAFGNVQAQSGDDQTYQNDTLGLSFQYPAGWAVSEQLTTRTITAASKADLDALVSGKTPEGLLFTVTLSSFRIIGAERIDDFAPILTRLTNAASDASPESITIGGAKGLQMTTGDAKSPVASRTAIVSIGSRRVAVIRGLATGKSWQNGAADQLDKLIDSLAFQTPQTRDDLDSFGQALWQLPIEKITQPVALAVSADTASLYVTDRDAGVWRVGANATLNELNQPAGIKQFGPIGVFADGTQIVGDPSTHRLFKIESPGRIDAYLTITADESAPLDFAFGRQGAVYVLTASTTNKSKGLLIQPFKKDGTPADVWDLSGLQSAPIDSPRITSDDTGNVYLIGKNTDGVYKFSPAGALLEKRLGVVALTDTTPLAIIADRTESLYVATQEQGILKLDPTGKLSGIIGEPYDEAAPPKVGQLGRPTALALADDGHLLYVVDSGKYHQIVAFGLSGGRSVNVLAGTRDGGTIDYNQTVKGEITSTQFMSTYKFNAKFGDVLTILMRPDEGSTIDPYVDLINPRGIRTAANDDTARDMYSVELGPKDAVIRSYHILLSGEFTIRATRFGRETTTATGAYTLTLMLERSNTPGTRIAPTITWTPSSTPTATATFTPTNTPTFTNTAPPTNTPSPTASRTPRPTRVPSNIPFPTFTRTPRPVTLTPTATRTATRLPTFTPSPSGSPTSASQGNRSGD